MSHEPIEEHDGAWIIQLVHLRVANMASALAAHNAKGPKKKLPTRLVEVRYLRDVAEVNDGVVLNLFGDRVQRLVHHHALRVPVVPETDDDDAVLFGFDRLVDVPARGEVRQEIGHLGC